jgi:hypothetical protein
MARGPKGPELVVIYWRDIPAQVNGQLGRQRHQVLLSEKFQRAVDRAKRKAHIDTAAEDVAQWRRQSHPCDGDLAAAANALAQQIEEEFTRERLGLLAFAGGWATDVGADRVHAAELAALEEIDEADTSEEDAATDASDIKGAAEQDAMSTSDGSDIKGAAEQDATSTSDGSDQSRTERS